jgi:type IV pilus assembly protein PilW
MYVSSRKTYELNETVARLQETARYAISIIEPDVRQANYWGLLKVAGIVNNATSKTATTCGANFALDLGTNIQGDDGDYTLGCAAVKTGAVKSADTLTVRRTSAQISTVSVADKNALRICSTRTGGDLVNDVSGCTLAPDGQVNDLIVNTYYVDQDSDEAVGLPSLRRWSLTTDPVFADNEIVPGIEDMQIQFGIDPKGVGTATQYVNAAGPGTLGTAQVVAVRIWLLVRSEQPEVGFVDARTYVYGDRTTANGTTTTLNSGAAQGKAYKPGDGFHRLLISRTIMIRNEAGI